jgi:hypothetical protein
MPDRLLPDPPNFSLPSTFKHAFKSVQNTVEVSCKTYNRVSPFPRQLLMMSGNNRHQLTDHLVVAEPAARQVVVNCDQRREGGEKAVESRQAARNVQVGFGGAVQVGFGGALQVGFGGALQVGFGGAVQVGFGRAVRALLQLPHGLQDEEVGPDPLHIWKEAPRVSFKNSQLF